MPGDCALADCAFCQRQNCNLRVLLFNGQIIWLVRSGAVFQMCDVNRTPPPTSHPEALRHYGSVGFFIDSTRSNRIIRASLYKINVFFCRQTLEYGNHHSCKVAHSNAQITTPTKTAKLFVTCCAEMVAEWAKEAERFYIAKRTG